MNQNPQVQIASLAERLAFNRQETCAVLGGISHVTLWRYVKRGIIAPVAGTKGRLYSKKSITDFLSKSEGGAS